MNKKEYAAQVGSPVDWDEDRFTAILDPLSNALDSWRHNRDEKPIISDTKAIHYELEKAACVLDDLIQDVQHTIDKMEKE